MGSRVFDLLREGGILCAYGREIFHLIEEDEQTLPSGSGGWLQRFLLGWLVKGDPAIRSVGGREGERIDPIPKHHVDGPCGIRVERTHGEIGCPFLVRQEDGRVVLGPGRNAGPDQRGDWTGKNHGRGCIRADVHGIQTPVVERVTLDRARGDNPGIQDGDADQ